MHLREVLPAHTQNPSTQQAEEGRSVSLKPAWSRASSKTVRHTRSPVPKIDDRQTDRIPALHRSGAVPIILAFERCLKNKTSHMNLTHD